MKRKKPGDVTDAEIINMIEIINKRAKRFDIQVWDRQLFENLGISKGGNPISIEEFNKMFEDKRNYGIKMLQDASSRNYIWKTNKKYKETIAQILDRMGLQYDAETVRNMTYKDFMKLEHNDKWSYVYDQYSSYKESVEADKQGQSDAVKEIYVEISKNISRHLIEVLGY